MSEPICGWCYEAALPESQRRSTPREATTMWLCPRHQATHDSFMESFGPLLIRKAAPVSKETMLRTMPFEVAE